MSRARLRPRWIAYAACVLGMLVCASGPLEIRDADNRHQHAVLAGTPVQARVVGVGHFDAAPPLRPVSAYHDVEFEHADRMHAARLAGVPAPGIAAVEVLVAPDGSVSSALALDAKRARALPATFGFIAALLALLHMLTVDAIRRRAGGREPALRRLELVTDLDLRRAA